MKLALMQPYFIPYLSYFELVSRVDRFIFFDTVQYMKGGWINRNRIMKSENSWRYLTVPIVRHHLDTRICDIEISEKRDWRREMLIHLEFYKDRAPFYKPVTDLFRNCIEQQQVSLLELNVNSVKAISSYIGVHADFDLFSTAEIEIEPPTCASEWALNVARSLKADEYINLPGGKEIYSDQDFREAGMKLTFLELPELEYNCGGHTNLSHLSILDVLMWVPSDIVRDYLLRHGNNEKA